MREYINTLDVPIGETVRTICPKCGGENRLTVTNRGADIVYNCYSASCATKGIQRREYGYDDLKQLPLLRTPAPIMVPFELPDWFVDIKRHDQAVSYLKQVNCYTAYATGDVMVKYDTKLERVVFISDDKLTVAGRGVKPKWYNYTHNSLPFIVNNAKSTMAVLVEDVPSAVHCSKHHTGFALLGTNFLPSYLSKLTYFDTVTICLDADATNKAIQMQHQLSPFVRTIVRPLSKDLKYFTADELAEFWRVDGG